MPFTLLTVSLASTSIPNGRTLLTEIGKNHTVGKLDELVGNWNNINITWQMFYNLDFNFKHFMAYFSWVRNLVTHLPRTPTLFQPAFLYRFARKLPCAISYEDHKGIYTFQADPKKASQDQKSPTFGGDHAGVLILPTQTMHYYKGNPSKLPFICSVSFPPNG